MIFFFDIARRVRERKKKTLHIISFKSFRLSLPTFVIERVRRGAGVGGGGDGDGLRRGIGRRWSSKHVHRVVIVRNICRRSEDI